MRVAKFRHMCVLACAVVVAGCASSTLIDPADKWLAVADDTFSSNGRVFHKTLHYPNALGLRSPGFIVGMEKAYQDLVTGPAEDPTLTNNGTAGWMESYLTESTHAYYRLRNDPKAHVITHVTKYEPDKEGVFPGRIVPCSVYSLVRPDGRTLYDEKGNLRELPKPAQRISAGMGEQQFPVCEDWSPFNPSKKDPRTPYAGAFKDGWRAIKALKDELQKTLCPESEVKNGKCLNGNPEGYTHIMVIVMGWNTPQDNAIENFNSITGHLLDEVQMQAQKSADTNAYLNSFKPLVIGVTWPSLWQLGGLSFIPDDVVRLFSFANKANDAKEVGVTWLKALMEHAVLPAREMLIPPGAEEQLRSGANLADISRAPRVVYIGHSFGARATLASITNEQGLNTQAPFNSNEVSGFAEGDRYIVLQGAFKIEEILEDENENNPVSEKLKNGNLKTVLTTSAYDSANELAKWNTYAGMIDAHKKICDRRTGTKKEYWSDVSCAYIPKQGEPTALSYGLGICDKPGWKRHEKDKYSRWSKEMEGPAGSLPSAFSPETWQSQSASVLYLDVSEMANCRAAFTGGGSHSDIYRRETARLLWDLIK